ncbi:hypothetical protein EPA93_12725 [Ktedonosporobacter rubrisoli]|uniref:Uncharacterized protein n=1 Tax=Ktedonosporobacter rubrisoli TaxID=2509675 RepID=A0A4P6K763_KTERU|nr:hypothetical protein EPA93_12725 [Ktedonosporobacter rubrisoli]
MPANALLKEKENPSICPLSSFPLSGSLGLQQAGNGNQVEYNGHLLYTYIGNMSPGQVTGHNVNNWFVAALALS